MSKPKKKFDQSNVTNLDEARSLAKKKFHPQDLIPLTGKNTNQERMIRAIKDPSIDVVMGLGCAGVGKSFIAVLAALELVFDQSTPYDQVIIVRSAVQSRDIGFVKGDQDEKNSVFEGPYIDLVGEVIKYSGNQYENLKALGYLRFETTSFLRGKTFDRAIIIFDETQNADYEELSTVITRVGEYSKLIMCGDHRQNDLSRKRKEKSGLGRFERVLMSMPEDMAMSIHFTPDDVVRSRLCKEFIKADYYLQE